MWQKVIIAGLGMGGIGVAGVVGLLGSAQIWGDRQLARTFDIEVSSVETSTEPAVLKRGEQLARHIALCVSCHGDDMSGGEWMEVPGLVHLYTPNLTGGKGSPTADYTDDDWVRAIRHGVARDGHGLVTMPIRATGNMSAEDMGALISWVKLLPDVDHTVPQTELYAPVRAMWMLGVVPLQEVDVIDHDAQPLATIEREASVEYGEYLASISCHGCHGEDLAGAEGSDITPTVLADWTFGNFNAALRGGVSKDGRPLDEQMPWRHLAGLPDTEMRALWAYVSQVPPS